MNIGFDLDKIFINTPPLIPATVIDKLYKKKENGTLLYRIPSAPEQKLRILSHHPLFRPIIKKNLDFVKTISREKNKLYLISSRFGFLRKRTNSIIQKTKLDTLFDGMYFNYDNQQPHIFKDGIIQKLHLDIYIDDDLSLLKYVAPHNIKTKFYWLNERVSKPLTKNITAITILSDIF